MNIEQQILEACLKAKEKGIHVMPGTWGDGIISACPLTCVMVENEIPIPEDPTSEDAAKLLAPILGEVVTPDWVMQFMLGFDGEFANKDGEVEAYQIGYRLRHHPSLGLELPDESKFADEWDYS